MAAGQPGSVPGGLDSDLVKRLADDHPGIRYQAVQDLAGKDGPDVIAALADRLASDDHSGVRGLVVSVLDGRNAPEATAALARCADSDDYGGVRYAARKALAGREPPAGRDRDTVIELLKESFAAGSLTLDELRGRTGTVLAASTVRELKQITADLPALSSAVAADARGRGARSATSKSPLKTPGRD